MQRNAGWLIALAGSVLLAACGSSSSGNSGTSGSNVPTAPTGPTGPTGTQTGFVITIKNMTFSPADLSVPPGGVVTVINEDGFQHSVTSTSAAGNFTPGAVAGVSFDTTPFTGTTSFTIPANAPNGTVIPFFCTVHRSAMTPPFGNITVDSTAQPTGTTGATGTTGTGTTGTTTTSPGSTTGMGGGY